MRARGLGKKQSGGHPDDDLTTPDSTIASRFALLPAGYSETDFGAVAETQVGH